jgi:hypothetical protein
LVPGVNHDPDHRNREQAEWADLDMLEFGGAEGRDGRVDLRPRRTRSFEEGTEELVRDIGGGRAGDGPVRRHLRNTTQERAVRRRRREAIVLNEGDHPLGQDDIIQRSMPFMAGR